MATPVDPDFDAYQKRILAVFQTAYEAALKIGKEAFDGGKVIGKNIAAAELRAKVAGILNDAPAKETAPPEPPPEDDETEAKRARRGSVRPAVVEALRKAPNGLKTNEVAEHTGMNENSVRGTLNILLDELVTVKKGDRWFLNDQK
jgi:hypothetical protein